jgi:hypothetical protein
MNFTRFPRYTGYQQKTGNLPIFEVKRVLFTPPDGAPWRRVSKQILPKVFSRKVTSMAIQKFPLVPTMSFAGEGGLT